MEEAARERAGAKRRVRAGTTKHSGRPALTLAPFLDASPYRACASRLHARPVGLALRGAFPLPEGEGSNTERVLRSRRAGAPHPTFRYRSEPKPGCEAVLATHGH